MRHALLQNFYDNDKMHLEVFKLVPEVFTETNYQIHVQIMTVINDYKKIWNYQ